jgi:hypothetical protein
MNPREMSVLHYIPLRPCHMQKTDKVYQFSHTFLLIQIQYSKNNQI